MKKLIFIYKENQKYGFKNKEKKIIINPNYDEVKEFIENFCWVRIGNTWKLIDVNNKVLINQSFNSIIYFDKQISIGFKEKQYFYIDNDKLIIKLIPCDQVLNFSENLLLVKKNDQIFYIDLNFKIKAGPYLNGLLFKDGFAPVLNNLNKWGIINQNGGLVINYQYKKIFQNGADLFKVIDFNDVSFFIDLHNNHYLEKNNNYEFGDYFSDNCLIIKHKNKWGAITVFFETMFLKSIDYLFPFENGYAVYQKNNKYGILNKKGWFITSPIFDKVWYKDLDYFCVSKDNKLNYFNIYTKNMIYK